MLLFIYELVSSFNFDTELRAQVISLSFYTIVIITNFSTFLLYCVKFIIAKTLDFFNLTKPNFEPGEQVVNTEPKESFDEIADGIEMSQEKIIRKSSVNSI